MGGHAPSAGAGEASAACALSSIAAWSAGDSIPTPGVERPLGVRSVFKNEEETEKEPPLKLVLEEAGAPLQCRGRVAPVGAVRDSTLAVSVTLGIFRVHHR